MKKVLFLCTGNYYRSRFAEIWFNWRAAQAGLPWSAESRGLALSNKNPGPMSQHTLTRLSQLGVPVESYLRLPLSVSSEDFIRAHHVVAVKATEHRPIIAEQFPTVMPQVEFWEVHDLDCAGPEVAFPHLEREIDVLFTRLQQKWLS